MLVGSHVPARSVVLEQGRISRRSRAWNHHAADLEQLGLRHRRIHDTRRTFITLARVDGARKDVIEQISHGGRNNIIDLYTTLPWSTLCEAVECPKLRLLSPEECRERQEVATAAEEARLAHAQADVHEDTDSKRSGNGDDSSSRAQTAVVGNDGRQVRTLRPSGNGVGRSKPLSGRAASRVTSRVTGQQKRRERTNKAWKDHVKSVGAEIPVESSRGITLHIQSDVAPLK